MYPHLRMAWHLAKSRLEGPLDLEGTGVLRTRVGLGDIDFYPEFNNGRYLTLMDLGRLHLASRTGLLRVAHRNKWNFFIAGGSLRYRHRIPFLSRIGLSTRAVGHDRRWFYFHQVFSIGDKPCFSGLVRGGLKSDKGMVPVAEVLAALGRPDWDPPLPDWVAEWARADTLRPWPPEDDPPHREI